MHAQFQLSKLIFKGEDRFFLWRLGSKIAIFRQILTKINNFEGSKILKNKNSKIFKSPLYISPKPKLALLDQKIPKKRLLKYKKMLFLKNAIFPIFVSIAFT